MGYAIRPLSFGEILDGAFALLRARWRAILVATALLGVPAVAFQQLFLLPMVTAAATGGFLAGIVALAAQTLVTMLTSIPSSAAVSVILADTYLGRPCDFAHVAERTRGVLWGRLYTDLFLFAYTGIGFLFFLVPGLWLSFHYAVVGPVVVIERRAGPAALRRSYELVRGARGRTALLMLTAISLTAALIGAPIWVFSGVPVAKQGMIIAAASLGGLYLNAAFTVLYFDRVCRREAFDIEHLAQLVEARDAVPMES